MAAASAPAVAVISPGSMGAALGRILVTHGLEVTTCVERRSAASEARALAAGMRCVAFAELAQADIVLAIVPPSVAREVAARIAATASFLTRKPIYVDCNAVAPQTMMQIGALITAAGGRCIDAGIVGGPPGSDGAPAPVLYASGEHAGALAALANRGLDVHILEAPLGSASALKMCIAGLSKGMTALFALSAIGASRAGVADAFREQIGRSHPALLAWTGRQVGSLSRKSYRWVAEMQELAQFLAPTPGARELFAGAADLYAWISQGARPQQAALADLERFFNPPPDRGTPPGPGDSSRK